jgi:hypothetical protein
MQLSSELRAELARLGPSTEGDMKTLLKRLGEAESKEGLPPSSHAQTISSPVEEMRGRMAQMFQEGLFSDVTIVVTSARHGECSTSLDLHRNVLVHNDFFRGMFTRSFRESGEKTVKVEVAEGSSVAASVLVLEYLYTSNIVINNNNVFEVLAAADKLQLTSLCESCEAYLAHNLCEGSVCSIWKASHILGLSQLEVKCKDLILSEGRAVLEGGSFSELPKELAIAVVADEELNAREEVVFEAVVAWGEANKASNSVSDAITEFLPHLRFVEMGHTFIYKRVRQSGLIPENMLSEVLCSMLDDKIPRLEPGCKQALDIDCENEAAARPAKRRRRG